MYIPFIVIEKKPNPEYIMALMAAQLPFETAREILQKYTAKKKTCAIILKITVFIVCASFLCIMIGDKFAWPTKAAVACAIGFFGGLYVIYFTAISYSNCKAFVNAVHTGYSSLLDETLSQI